MVRGTRTMAGWQNENFLEVRIFVCLDNYEKLKIDLMNQPSDSQNEKDEIIPPSATAEFVSEPESSANDGNCSDFSIPNPNNNSSTEITVEKKESHLHSWIGNGIQFVLAVFTGWLLFKTTEANKTSKEAVEQATEANRISRENLEFSQQSFRRNDSLNRENFESSQISSLRSDSFTRENLQLAQRSVASQIRSLDEAKKQFEYSNLPFLQIENIKLKGRTITYSVTNLGNYPAQIKYIYHNTNCEDGERIVRLKDGTFWTYPGHISHARFTQNKYVLKGVPVTEVPAHWGDPRTKNMSSNHLLRGKIYYENQITKKIRVHCFNISLNILDDSLSVVYGKNYNYNFDLKNAPKGVGGSIGIDLTQ